MAWDDGLLPEQVVAARHVGRHARLLAGPGTGKTLTLTRHVCFLVSEREVPPDHILAVTFTRAAARELRQRVENELGTESCPRISTLHSFALRQLLRNAGLITDLPQPLRIADDWEERNIILEDVKRSLGLRRVGEARSLLNELSADWQSLTADEADWDRRFPNPQFLGIWREHRQIYGYTLRAELVYQLKKVLETRRDFEVEGTLEYLLVDEYQDLNRCDLRVIHEIASRGVELFIAGDDDQSIYGFRKAHPEGIRRFPRDYAGAEGLSLEVCKRCDCAILEVGLFVARQDPRRIEKAITPEHGRGTGEVALLGFRDQDAEAGGIADICTHLVNVHGLQPDDILILLRSDHNCAFSNPICQKIAGAGIPVAATSERGNPLDGDDARALLAFMRLAVNDEDSLAWRTLLHLWCDGAGPGAVDAIYDVAHSRGQTFAEAIRTIRENPNLVPTSQRSRVAKAIRAVLKRLGELFPSGALEDHDNGNDLMQVVRRVAESFIEGDVQREFVLSEFGRAAAAVDATSVADLVHATEVAGEDIQQELQEGCVNLLTMHKAKGLTAKAVIVAAVEDQYIPGRADGDAVDDERRLLYVSLTRAKHYLFMTYCDRRTGSQRYTGRDSGKPRRSLSRFLVDCPYPPQDARTFINSLKEEDE
jgi:DNA helicase-2/ATP-dependent DNA helicase PcrA